MYYCSVVKEHPLNCEGAHTSTELLTAQVWIIALIILWRPVNRIIRLLLAAAKKICTYYTYALISDHQYALISGIWFSITRLRTIFEQWILKIFASVVGGHRIYRRVLLVQWGPSTYTRGEKWPWQHCLSGVIFPHLLIKRLAIKGRLESVACFCSHIFITHKHNFDTSAIYNKCMR